MSDNSQIADSILHTVDTKLFVRDRGVSSLLYVKSHMGAEEAYTLHSVCQLRNAD